MEIDVLIKALETEAKTLIDEGRGKKTEGLSGHIEGIILLKLGLSLWNVAQSIRKGSQ